MTGEQYVFAWAGKLLTISRHPTYSRKTQVATLNWAQNNKIKLNIKKDKSAIISIMIRGRQPKKILSLKDNMMNQ